MELHETQQVHSRQGPLHDHYVVVCVVLPVQQFNYLRNAGALIGNQCQANLHEGGVWDDQAKLKKNMTVRWMWFYT